MKNKNWIRLIAGTAALLTVLSAAVLPGCVRPDNPGTTENPEDVIPTPPPVHYAEYTGENGKTITLAAKEANGVNGYFTDISESRYILRNQNAFLSYNLMPTKDNPFAGPDTLSNSTGGVYLSRTMDSYVTTTAGQTYFAGGSSGRANLFDQGYYYYNLHVFDQSFNAVSEDTEFTVRRDLPLTSFVFANEGKKPVYTDSGSVILECASVSDPYWAFRLDSPVSPADCQGFLIRARSTTGSSYQIFYDTGSNFNAAESVTFSLIPDGEFHSVFINFPENVKKNLVFVRVDIDAAYSNESIEISDISVVKLKSDVPTVMLDRNYNFYTDKINETVRYLAYEKCDNIAEIGTVTKIGADTVEKFVIADANGSHNSLEEVDQNSIRYAGFDIKGAGIFGYVLEPDPELSGKLTVTLEDGNYVLTQSVPVSGSLKKGNSFSVSRMLFTGEGHSFTPFLQAAEDEQHPLTGNNVTVETEGKKKNKYTFDGYDCKTGAYTFTVQGENGFDDGYENPYAEHKITVSVTGINHDRKIYVRTRTSDGDGSLECAVLLDGNNQVLPVKMEVCKNFAHDGEELFYTDNDSDPYGISVFPLVCETGKDEKFTVCHLYECWGKYRLKQISSIRFHLAYYHLSLGVTETNCMTFYRQINRLPDHRGLSQLYWSDVKVDILDAKGNKTGKQSYYNQQPQHTNNGSHTFFSYLDKAGNTVKSENAGNTVIASSGPVYTDITLNYLTQDHKVNWSYRHVEMPSTDENRAFCEVNCQFTDTVEIANVRDGLTLYQNAYPYLKLGYLDKNNQSVITDAKTGGTQIFELGDEFPYFSYFSMKDSQPDIVTAEDTYGNGSLLVLSLDAVIGGKPYTGGLALVEGDSCARITLNLDGKATFKAGDTICFRFILMPWGNNESTDDRNVRNVRINTCLNPIQLTPFNGASVSEDPFVPHVDSPDGAACEFTVSGGCQNVRDLPGYATKEYTRYRSVWERDYNVALVVGGFTKLGVPQVEENVNGTWIPYVLSSEELGYDGYMVFYNPDGTFSYTFAVTMTEAKDRTFRVTVK